MARPMPSVAPVTKAMRSCGMGRPGDVGGGS
jgi:hypothetical protein